jgi:hypothetical protein
MRKETDIRRSEIGGWFEWTQQTLVGVSKLGLQVCVASCDFVDRLGLDNNYPLNHTNEHEQRHELRFDFFGSE